MVNKELRARLKPKDRYEFERLKVTLGLKDLFGSDRETINKAVELAHKHLNLKDRLKDLFGGFL